MAKNVGSAQMTLERILRDDDDNSGQSIRVWRIIVAGGHVTIRGSKEKDDVPFLLIRRSDIPVLIADLTKAAEFEVCPVQAEGANDGR